MPIVMYGIVSNAVRWWFLKWVGPVETSTFTISRQFDCEFKSDSDHIDGAELILRNVVSIIKSQLDCMKKSRQRV